MNRPLYATGSAPTNLTRSTALRQALRRASQGGADDDKGQTARGSYGMPCGPGTLLGAAQRAADLKRESGVDGETAARILKGGSLK